MSAIQATYWFNTLTEERFFIPQETFFHILPCPSKLGYNQDMSYFEQYTITVQMDRFVNLPAHLDAIGLLIVDELNTEYRYLPTYGKSVELKIGSGQDYVRAFCSLPLVPAGEKIMLMEFEYGKSCWCGTPLHEVLAINHGK